MALEWAKTDLSSGGSEFKSHNAYEYQHINPIVIYWMKWQIDLLLFTSCWRSHQTVKSLVSSEVTQGPRP